MSKKLFEEAIADAKAVKQAALANAKAALEEAITPKLQSMISAKLQEMEDTDDENLYEAEEDLDENQEELDEVDFDLDENEDIETEDDFSMEDDSEETVDDTDGIESEDVKIADLSIDEFKDIIRDVVQQEMSGGTGDLGGGEEDFSTEEEPVDTDMGGEDFAPEGDEENSDEDVDLDELLAELDSLNETDDELDESKEYEPKVNNKITAKKRGTNTINARGGTPGTGAPGFKKVGSIKESKNYGQAIKTIKTLRNELNEVNLLNAKLIYVNKLFKSNSLTESQKLKVIESFDKATTTKEAKLVFTTLQESFKKSLNKKSPIREHLGFASKATGGTPKQKIVEDATVERFKKLAGLK